MPDIHEILVAVDFSDGSNAALNFAAWLAEKTRANLHVLHVWPAADFLPVDERAMATDSFGKMIEAQAKDALERFVSDARARGIRISHAFAVAGAASYTIVETAKRQHYDLLVLGTRGMTGIARVLLGSVAERVVRLAPCPVVTVPSGFTEASPMKRVLVPVDYSEGSRLAVARGRELAARLGAELDVVHVWDRPSYVPDHVVVQDPSGGRRSLGELIHENVEREMREFLATCSANAAPGAIPAHRLLSGDPVTALLEELGKGQHDLVVVGTHGRTGLRRVLLGSVAERLIRLSPVPVVTVPTYVSERA